MCACGGVFTCTHALASHTRAHEELKELPSRRCRALGVGIRRLITRNAFLETHAQKRVFRTIRDFSKIALKNAPSTSKSDQERILQLQAEGKVLGKGLVHGNNDCCTDSLMQHLARRKHIAPHLAENEDTIGMLSSSC